MFDLFKSILEAIVKAIEIIPELRQKKKLGDIATSLFATYRKLNDVLSMAREIVELAENWVALTEAEPQWNMIEDLRDRIRVQQAAVADLAHLVLGNELYLHALGVDIYSGLSLTTAGKMRGLGWLDWAAGAAEMPYRTSVNPAEAIPIVIWWEFMAGRSHPLPPKCLGAYARRPTRRSRDQIRTEVDNYLRQSQPRQQLEAIHEEILRLHKAMAACFTPQELLLAASKAA